MLDYKYCITHISMCLKNLKKTFRSIQRKISAMDDIATA